MMTNTQTGVLIGFIIGVAWVAFGFEAVLLGGLFSAAGFFAGKIIDGQVDIQSYIQRYSK